MENKSNHIIFKAILQVAGAFLFLLILFVPSYVLIKYAPWTLVFIIPIFLFVYSAGVYSIIDDMFKALVDRRQSEIKEKYPHAYTRQDTGSLSLKERKAFLQVPEVEWVRKEEKALKSIKEKELRDKRTEEIFLALEKKAPHGIDLWLKKNDYVASWRNPIPLADIYSGTFVQGLLKRVYEEEAVREKDVIFELEQKYQRSVEDNEWVKAQKSFSDSVRGLIKKELKGLGFYRYSVPVLLVDGEVDTTETPQSFWQLFFHSYCVDDQLDYTHFSEKANLMNYLRGDCTVWTPLNYGVYNGVIINAIKTLREKYEDLAVIVYNDNVITQWFEKLIRDMEEAKGTFSLAEQDKLYASIVVPLDAILFEKHIPTYHRSDLSNINLQNKKLIIITNYTATSEIISFTQQLWEHYPESRPCISFLSLFKELSTEEMQALIDKKNNDIVEEEEKKRKEQELIDSIPSKVEGWETLSPFCKLKIKYLLDYYPITVEFKADEEEWEDRWTVWHFKNDPEKTSEHDHQRALNRVVPKFASLLKDTFGEESLKYLTLVCIPASTEEKNNARYKEFSERLCQETGIENGFSHIHLTRDRVAKREGGNADDVSIANYSFDDSFFNGKRVILLDDIITKGNSMRIAKAKLEKLGAQVICGLSVGKTRHERRSERPDMEEE